MSSFYGTVWKLPCVRTYEYAKRIYDKTKPIRGKTIRPFGARRDHDTYSITAGELDGRDVVQVYMYQGYTTSPLLTYYQDNTVVITPSKYALTRVNQVIERVLGIPANGLRRRTNLRIANKSYAVDPAKGESITLRLPESGGEWEVLTKKEYYDWRIDRKGAKIVRDRYQGFADYLQKFVRCRLIDDKLSSGWEDTKSIMVHVSEYAKHFPELVIKAQELRNTASHLLHIRPGYAKIGHPYGSKPRYGGEWNDNCFAIELPHKYRVHDRTSKEYASEVGEFMLLVLSNDLTKWYKAALLMCSITGKSWSDRHNRYVLLDDSVACLKVGGTHDPNKYFEEVIFKFHNAEVLKRIKLPEGQVPTHKYDGWVIDPEG